MDEAMKIFNMFDKDGSGAIDAEELGEALRAMGHNLSHAEVSVYIFVRVCLVRVVDRIVLLSKFSLLKKKR